MTSLSHALTLGPASRTETCRPEAELRYLMELYEHRLFTWVQSFVHDSDAAVDCTQETFLRAYQSLRRGKAVNKQWLYKVARNLAIDEIRRRGRTAAGLDLIAHLSAESRERDLSVEQTMALLPEKDRTVLYLFSVAGFKTDEIGSMLGIGGPAVRQRLYRARERFRALYGSAAA
ncbi:MAG TPA: sigma-70 family RNA polymerase sigma factor [Chloroflexota bacterium]